EWATAINLVAEFFNDPNKTMIWFKTPNPQLGDMSPRDMIRIGRFKKLFSFIQSALNDNKK
ncbi:MAG TPA: MbcA/ParS/Xre antitoxin family protein, partial [Aquella sp.]|nr:MbcA/ParS/Xre antitoxin family protein [Aquella sp.]